MLQRGLLSIEADPDLIQTFQLDQFNRPFIDATIDFNISHSTGLVGCALQKRGSVGLDIEQIRPIDLNDFKSVFTEEEFRFISQSNTPKHSFFDCWTKKEAVMKANGKGFRLNPRSINVLVNPVSLDAMSWHLKKISLRPEYAIHLASSSKHSFQLQCLELEDLIR